MSQVGNSSAELLFVDDEEPLHNYLIRNLKPLGYGVVAATTWERARALIDRRESRPDVIFIDPAFSNRKAPLDLSDVCEEADQIPVVVLSSIREPRRIVHAIQSGAQDYLCKPIEIKQIQDSIDRVLQEAVEAPEAKPKKRALGTVEFIYCNPRMKQIDDMVRQIAETQVPVLIHGESGVGKDILAQLVHGTSPRQGKPFVKVNCAALPSELVESELFGHEKGAFTGAHTDCPGKFEFAHGGTIFLDEITEFSPPAQAKLLQVLQDKRFTRLGSNAEVHVDARVIAATNRDIEEAIEKGSFREDLYYRLNVVNIDVPPLRLRKDEIGILGEFFLAKFSREFRSPVKKLPEEILAIFRAYHWPGNVRELENVVKRYAVLQDAESIRADLGSKSSSEMLDDVEEMTERVLTDSTDELDLKEIRRQAAAIVERNLIRKTLQRTNWNKLRTAKALKVSYKTLLSKIEQHGIRP